MKPTRPIASSILDLRGRKVMIDADLAEVYGVTTKALNQVVARNKGRFPTDFTFRLNPREKTEVVTNCDHLAQLKFSPVLPHAFTEGVPPVRWRIQIPVGPRVERRYCPFQHAELNRRAASGFNGP